MTKTVMAVVAAALLAGCANIQTPLDDGYRVGDLGRTAYGGAGRILELQHEYCVNGDPLARGLLLLSVRAVIPDYPKDGLCTDLYQALAEASADDYPGTPGSSRSQIP